MAPPMQPSSTPSLHVLAAGARARDARAAKSRRFWALLSFGFAVRRLQSRLRGFDR
jgi:hypothetical protein